MRYEVLGPLRIVDRDDAHSIRAQKIETLLSAFLINANQVLSIDQLMAEIWGETAPHRAWATFHVYICQLRKFLRQIGNAADPIVTHPAGYALQAQPGQLDVHQFSKLVREGRRLTKVLRHEEAQAAFEAALGLCRGQALGSLPGGPIVKQFRAWVEEARLECTELLIDSELELGNHRELVGRLSSLTVEHPYHETFYRQLMLALYRSERQVDALEVYRRARTTLTDELGVEPCRGLRELQHAILTADDRLELAA